MLTAAVYMSGGMNFPESRVAFCTKSLQQASLSPSLSLSLIYIYIYIYEMILFRIYPFKTHPFSFLVSKIEIVTGTIS